MPHLFYKKADEVEFLLKFTNPQDQLGSDFPYVNATAAEGKNTLQCHRKSLIPRTMAGTENINLELTVFFKLSHVV